ncbi:unnamed protein product, partial [Rotaria sp. Silwood2]
KSKWAKTVSYAPPSFNYIEKFLRKINDAWIYESNLSLQPEALERVKADANQSTESVSREEIILID